MASIAPRPYPERIAWFHQARFGLFVHYGLYTLLGRGEWVQWQERIPAADYHALARRFRPAPDCVDRWLDLAVAAGMKYAVLTTKHHDGFCLYDTATTDFKTTGPGGCGRDLVAEFVAGCRKRGLKVGLYLSNIDWNHPGYFEPSKYPKSKDALVASLHAQTEELLTRYGEIDLLWFDGDWVDHGRKKVPSRAAFWQSRKLLARIYALQPRILVNNRLGLPADLDTPEQHVKASAPGRGWESCMTIGDAEAWGWSRFSPNRKTVATLLQNLVTTASGEGNFILNIGPRPDGRPDPEDAKRLLAVGAWMERHGEAIYGSQRYFADYTRHWQGAYTRKGDTVYLSLFRYSAPEIPVPLLRPLPRRATLLGHGPLGIEPGPNGGIRLTGLPAKPPVPIQPVIKLEFARPPRRIDEPDHAAWIAGDVRP
jgi:alpha-L-fucosidase